LFTLAQSLFATALQLAQKKRGGVFVNSQLIHWHHVAAGALDPKWIRPEHGCFPAKDAIDFGDDTVRQNHPATAPKMFVTDPARPTPPLAFGQRAKGHGCHHGQLDHRRPTNRVAALTCVRDLRQQGFGGHESAFGFCRHPDVRLKSVDELFQFSLITLSGNCRSDPEGSHSWAAGKKAAHVSYSWGHGRRQVFHRSWRR
jgi:hypothetical protein